MAIGGSQRTESFLHKHLFFAKLNAFGPVRCKNMPCVGGRQGLRQSYFLCTSCVKTLLRLALVFQKKSPPINGKKLIIGVVFFWGKTLPPRPTLHEEAYHWPKGIQHEVKPVVSFLCSFHTFAVIIPSLLFHRIHFSSFVREIMPAGPLPHLG